MSKSFYYSLHQGSILRKLLRNLLID